MLVQKGLMALLCGLLVVLFNVTSCSDERKRPIGFHRLGPIQRYMSDMVEVPDHRLVVRYDSQGFSSMSTQCSRDLNPLSKKEVAGRQVYSCDLCGSQFSLDGQPVSGPAHTALPYYSLHIDAPSVGAAKDTLYVRVGDEVSAQWRLLVPGEAG